MDDMPSKTTPIESYARIIRKMSGQAATPALLKKILRLRSAGLAYAARTLLPSPYINRADNTIRFARK